MSLRLALRALFRSPWYAATATGTIALTIALGATVFAVVDGVLFKPLPYPESSRLFTAVGSATPAGALTDTAWFAVGDVRIIRDADSRILVTATGGGLRLVHPDDPDAAIGAIGVDEQFFDVLGMRPRIGGFTASHFVDATVPGAAQPAVVSDGVWRRWLGADPGAVGRIVDIGGTRLLIAGVLPRDFVFPTSAMLASPGLLVPMVAPAELTADRWVRGVQALIRLRDGISIEQAQDTIDRALAARAHEYVPRDIRPGPYVAVKMTPIDAELGQTERRLFRVAFGGAGLLILLGAINVTGLFGARARDRQRELAVRTALGGGRRHLVAILMSEAIVIALAGGALGAALAGPVLGAALSLLPPTVTLLKAPAIDWRVVAFALAASVVPVLLFALSPALSAARHALTQRLSGGETSTPRTRSWGGRSLLVAESAIGLTLIIVGSLTLASFVVLRAENPGFDADMLTLIELRVPGGVAPPERAAREARALAAIERLPGVTRLATIGAPLLQGMYAGSRFRLPEGAERVSFSSDIPVSRLFFQVAGLHVVDGRALAPEEIDSGQPLAVVSEDVARTYWPGRRAVGQLLESGTDSITVVGVVEAAKLGGQDEDSGRRTNGEIYIPATRRASPFRVILLRTAGDPEAIARAVALMLARDVPGVLVARAESFNTALAKSVRLHRFRTVLFSLAGGAGLLVLAVGIAGIVAIGVARRVRELGIRAAIGAQRNDLITMIVLDHLRPAALGICLGLLASWWATRLVSGFLFKVNAHEPLVWSAAVATLLIVATTAAWLPARRASAVDPMTVLKAE